MESWGWGDMDAEFQICQQAFVDTVIRMLCLNKQVQQDMPISTKCFRSLSTWR